MEIMSRVRCFGVVNGAHDIFFFHISSFIGAVAVAATAVIAAAEWNVFQSENRLVLCAKHGMLCSRHVIAKVQCRVLAWICSFSLCLCVPPPQLINKLTNFGRTGKRTAQIAVLVQCKMRLTPIAVHT